MIRPEVEPQWWKSFLHVFKIDIQLAHKGEREKYVCEIIHTCVFYAEGQFLSPCVCVGEHEHLCATAMCLPGVMSYNLGTVFILQTCSSTHAALLARKSGMNHLYHPPSSLLTRSSEVCVCVCEFVEIQQSKIYLLICPTCPPSMRSNKVFFSTVKPFYPEVKAQLELQLFYQIFLSWLCRLPSRCSSCSLVPSFVSLFLVSLPRRYTLTTSNMQYTI